MSEPRSPSVVSVNEWNFQAEVLDSALPVLVDVSAEWCAPCKLAAPVIDAISRSYAGRLKVVEIDGGEAAELVARLGVRGFPTFLGFARGELVERRLGFAGKRPLEEMAQTLLAPGSG